jgi:hypothetical protein
MNVSFIATPIKVNCNSADRLGTLILAPLAKSTVNEEAVPGFLDSVLAIATTPLRTKLFEAPESTNAFKGATVP